MEGFRMEDGSGLARSNLVTARQLASILQHMARSPVADDFYESLPVAGKSGTLRNIGNNTSAEGRVVGKSGTISRVINYAGYVNSMSGKRYAYAILFNNFSCSDSEVKKLVERAMVFMAEL
jgi:D-alanyl-D-alanine carboxypeptidase/D-alanyl-D-alanine-endopeptidase (penicillin-binding protein 4)